MSELSQPRTMAIIPIYQDGQKMLNVLNRFNPKTVDVVCLVADCVADEDLEKIQKTARAMGISLHTIENQKRRGVGNAIRKGIKYALDERYDVVVVMAGNDKDNPQEIPRLLKPILEVGFDYVQGSRFLPGGKHVKTPFLRGLFSRLYPYLWTILTRAKCTDVTNGFRAYSVKIFSDKRINIWQKWLDGYELEYYLHYKVLTLGYRVKEVPVSKIYSHRHKGGYSKISPFRDWWKIVGPLIYLKLGLKD
jgi:dolichol-phosphate mannosyltransferase